MESRTLCLTSLGMTTQITHVRIFSIDHGHGPYCLKAGTVVRVATSEITFVPEYEILVPITCPNARADTMYIHPVELEV